MRAISLWQPWASLWCSPRKVHETRHWPTTHRGWLAVHAAKRFEKNFAMEDPLRAILDDEFGGHWAMDLPIGCIIGAVCIVQCWRTETHCPTPTIDDETCGDWTAGRYAWERDRYFILRRPIPLRGRQGMWELAADISGELQKYAEAAE